MISQWAVITETIQEISDFTHYRFLSALEPFASAVAKNLEIYLI
jgi:hypothetical protein